MAKYYLNHPRPYDENEWALTNGKESDMVPEGFRLAEGIWRRDLEEDEFVHCIYCLDEMGGRGGGDECLDYCDQCEMIMEGEPQVVLNEDEYNFLMARDSERR
jgi:hypothetical protein